MSLHQLLLTQNETDLCNAGQNFSDFGHRNLDEERSFIFSDNAKGSCTFNTWQKILKRKI